MGYLWFRTWPSTWVSWQTGQWQSTPRRITSSIRNCKAGFTSACERNTNDAWGRAARQNVWYILTLFVEAANRSYINVLYTNCLWCTDSRWIAFSCLPNIRRTAEYLLPSLCNTSTSNIRIIFECCVRILFVFRCKPGLRVPSDTQGKRGKTTQQPLNLWCGCVCLTR